MLIVWFCSFQYRMYGTCEIDWAEANFSSICKSYIISIFFCCFFLPVSIMFFSYVSIIKMVKSSHTLAGADDPTDRQRRLDRDVTRVSVVICTAFIVAWSPYAVISMWSAFGHSVPNLTSVLASLFAKSASFYNPIIYFGMNSKFRKDILVLLPCAKESKEPVKLKKFKNLRQKQGFTLQKPEKAHVLQVPDSGPMSLINTPPLGNRNSFDLACDNSDFECVRL
ncbi:opsin-5-like [Ornithorhynchus anatinus]|uniref:opsin-5-like n=1 Tax=Ornithorhynchus anatinus TaxID=9258 RepID=UPI0019D4CB8C|nr:opsin-5-like [Ornithorhynchus anatinus]